MKITPITSENQAIFAGFLSNAALDSVGRAGTLLLGSARDGAACGALHLAYSAYTAILCSVAVAEEHRGQGVGSALVAEACRLLEATSVRSLDAVASGSAAYMQDAAGFLRRNHFFRSDDGARTCTVRLGDLSGQERLRATGPVLQVLPLEEVPEIYLQVFNHFLSREEGADPVRPEELDARCSQVVVQEGQVEGCLLFSPAGEGALSLDWLYARASALVLPLLQAGFAALVRNYPPRTLLHMTVTTPAAAKILDKLLDGCPRAQEACVRYSRLILPA